MSKYVYNPWPLGKIDKKFQRKELDQLKESGYEFDDARDVVNIFEDKIANYAGSKFAVAVDSCTNALFLCLKYLNATGEITMPCRTWLSAALSVLHSGCKIKFEDFNWSGLYQLKPYPIYDSAVRFTKGMYVPGSYFCLSFQIKKRLPIGKGGMVLTDDAEAAKWIRCAANEGRNLQVPYNEDNVSFLGWNMYMTPEDAARGLLIFDQLDEINEDVCNQNDYHDISGKDVFK
jgi:dTDP-4-amino-4,6-dideoxygalactose transaminase